MPQVWACPGWSGPVQSRSGLLFSGSGGPQGRFKSFSSGFLRGSASKIRFGPHFGPILGVQNETPGLEKNIKIHARVVKNQGFAVLSLVRFRTPIWGPPWAPLWEGISPPSHAETSLLGGLGPSKSRFQLLFWAPRPPKTAPRAFQEPSKTAPRGLQQAKKLQEASGEPFGIHLDSMSDPIWT